MQVVVAIDGKLGAETALDFILERKYGQDTKIHLLHVLVPGFADVSVQGIPDPIAAERTEEKILLARMASLISDKTGAEVTTDILAGEVAEVVSGVCKQLNADEVIVPSHARHGFSRLWFGSLADDIVDAAPCTIIVLKMPQSSKS